MVQKQVRCSCLVQKLTPAVAFNSLMNRSCQDSNIRTDAENHVDAFKKKQKNRLFTAFFFKQVVTCRIEYLSGIVIYNHSVSIPID